MFRLRMRSLAERTVRILVESGQGGRTVFRADMRLDPGNWQVLSGTFVSAATEENARLEITSDTTGVFWIGAVSIQRADAFHGMRRDVIELLKRIKPGCLRYPGGCYAEFYPWKDGLLPVDERSPIGPVPLEFLLPHTDNYDTHEIGIDEFIALCREIGCEPAITVRLSENTPGDAAAWVEYCNGSSDTKWGAVRAGRGHKKPYNVRYWFVGNELYLFGRGPVKSSDGCSAQSRSFSEAMKKADPAIRLVACTNLVPFIATPGWNEALLPAGRGLFNCCSVHDYVLGHVPLKTDDDLGNVARAPTQKMLSVLQSARQYIDRETGKDKPLSIVLDEWNTYWGLTGNVCMGLYTAGFLNLLCRESGNLGIEMANSFQPITEGAIKVAPLAAELDTAGLVFELFRPHQGNHLLKLPDLPADGDIDACASISADGARIFVTLVNRSAHTDHSVELALNFPETPAKATATFLVARDVTRNQSVLDQRTEKLAVIAGHRLSVHLPRYSIVRIDVTLTTPEHPVRECHIARDASTGAWYSEL